MTKLFSKTFHLPLNDIRHCVCLACKWHSTGSSGCCGHVNQIATLILLNITLTNTNFERKQVTPTSTRTTCKLHKNGQLTPICEYVSSNPSTTVLTTLACSKTPGMVSVHVNGERHCYWAEYIQVWHALLRLLQIRLHVNCRLCTLQLMQLTIFP